ncbi:MAG: isochorismatase [Acidimicrobiaceae bacterium]|nr:isochorismatase [Acidimicrobiaceae bacterium]|tara:strand:+ start:372 stop:1001 length:630 start_codon:yes stop_codon:yes gene_type:complete
MDLKELVEPAHTALCVVECQNGVVGPGSSMPAVAEAAASAGLLERLGFLAKAARSVGVRVVHCTFHAHADLWGGSRNSLLFAVGRRSEVQQYADTDAVKPVPEIGFVEGSDIIVPRFHGLSSVSGTGLAPMLRNEGVTTVAVVGVSLNVAIPNTVFDLVNDGFQVVVPTDGSVATVPGYGEQVLEHTLAYVATLTDVSGLAEEWLEAGT